MELSNALGDFKIEPEKAGADDLFAVREALRSLILMLAPYAPHVAEELWEIITGDDSALRRFLRFLCRSYILLLSRPPTPPLRALL